jgi:hypothetical protein
MPSNRFNCYNCPKQKQDRHCTYSVTLRRVRATFVAVEKLEVLHIVSVCVCVFVDLGIQHPMCIRIIVICGLFRSTTFFYIIS